MEERTPRETAAVAVEVYREAADQPIAGGRWLIQHDDTVLYERPDGTVSPALITAATLRDSARWRRDDRN